MPDAVPPREYGHVLIIEDAADQRQVLADILESEGFAPLTAGSARETLEILQTETVAVAILDLRLPDVSGTELLGQIREIDPRMRIIVYTGHGTFASAIDAVNLGAFAYVEKPGEPEEIVRRVHQGARAWMKEALQESEERYKTLAEVAPVGIFRCSADGSCQYVNKRWQRMTGLRLEDVGRPDCWRRHIHPEDRERLVREWQEAVAQGRGFRSEYRLSNPGEPVWVVAQVLAETDLKGTVTGYVGAITDVTELRKARETAEAADRVKTQFLANINHELRTPIHTILGMARFLREAPPAPGQQDHLSALESAAESLLGLVDLVLDVSHTEGGGLSIEEDDFRIAEVTGDLRRLMAPAASEAGLALEISVDEAVPPWSRGDASRLLHVLLNLADNAIKFTPQGSVSLTVTPCVEGIQFRVRDTGIGMSEEEVERVFALFSQADSSMTRRFGGLGLGLTLSRRLVDLMGGSLTVESAPGAGSTFTVTVPLAPSARASAPGQSASAATPPPSDESILVVEDEPISRLILGRMLEKLGYRVATAENGREALAALERDRFDLVLMDCQMPEMDGYEATRQLRQREGESGASLPVVAVTAHAGVGDRERCLAAGMNDYLSKPFREAELVTVLDRWLPAGPS
jgi:PAS domain S-box-containing protein